ncbi:hypothetical protein BKP45_05735 [Anaerobacillus alkalidiazotrophicus]|uniref:Core domain-containing protein n=1 Tax=Anaerobacillus alkalidiazotrophicus TaxID=472963 RepID=A0A1S2MC48_9BACI|nr:iron-sulfur cluster biosynthesis family protein [Anaerobacillus alkalidiazotrophicus]OIJ22170.1 hypothetical protein BKP45_05735 [Anaerobacillus alkalidiazotrophicus]
MYVTFSSSAQKFLGKYVKQDGKLLLLYDTDGCGCAVNGVPVLHVLSGIGEENLQKIETNSIPLFMYSKHTVFFDELLEIVYQDHKLKLVSKNQIFTHHLQVKL